MKQLEKPSLLTDAILPYWINGWLNLLYNWIRGKSKYKKVTTTYTVEDNDFYIEADATTGAFTVTLLPATSVIEKEYIIKKTDVSANAVTVDGNGTNIDGTSTASLATQWTAISVKSNGTIWHIIAQI